MLLGVACHRLPEGTVPDDVTAEGLTFSQEFSGNEGFADGGVMEGGGIVRLLFEVEEGAVTGYVASPDGDVLIDGQPVPDDQGALITGEAWWDPDAEGCFAAAFTTVGESGLVARATGCELQTWIDVEIGAEGEIEEAFNLILFPPFDPFFYE